MKQITDHLRGCRDFYQLRLSSKFKEPVGTSPAAVSKLESELGITLPLAYRQFLLWMGKDTQGALKGSEWFIDDILENQNFLNEFLTENGVSNATGDQRLCFFSHQGYMAAWFQADEKREDPQCEFFSEANPDPVAVRAGPFSLFLLEELQGIAEALS